MSRTRDLALARMRMLVARLRQPGAGAASVTGAGAGSGARAGGVPCMSPGEPAGGGPEVGSDGVPDREPGGASSTTAPATLRLLAAFVVVVLGVGAWALARSWPRPEPVLPTAVRVSPAVAPPGDRPGGTGPRAEGAAGGVLPGDGPFGAAPSPSPSPSLVVHVAGDVRRPGLVTLPAGARVGDAVAAAGGLRRGGSLGAANLARVVADGERIEIGAAAPDQPGPGSDHVAVPGAAGPVDLNTATAAQLDALPGVGPVTAAKILAWRAEHGRFTVIDELAEVPGIGPKTLEELRPHVRV